MCSQVEDQNHFQTKALILNSVTAQRNEETIKEKSETAEAGLWGLRRGLQTLKRKAHQQVTQELRQVFQKI